MIPTSELFFQRIRAIRWIVLMIAIFSYVRGTLLSKPGTRRNARSASRSSATVIRHATATA